MRLAPKTPLHDSDPESARWSEMPDRSFSLSVLASVIGAAVFIPVDSVPWWMSLLSDDVPFGGWLWPPVAMILTFFVYRMGVRAGLDAANTKAPPRNGLQEKPRVPATLEPTVARVPTSSAPPEGPPVEPEQSPFSSLLWVAHSLAEHTAAEAERLGEQYSGTTVDVTGLVHDVSMSNDTAVVTLQPVVDAGPDAWIHVQLWFAPHVASAVLTLAKGTHLKAWGRVREVGRETILLDDCEPLQIGRPPAS